MASAADLMLRDGTLEFSGGADSSRSPAFIDSNQVASAVNATFRGGKAASRPGWVRRLAAGTFPDARFQHAGFYDGSGYPMLMASIGGKIYAVNPLKWSVLDVTPDSGNSSRIERGWSAQAEMFWIYQDGQSNPIIFNGSVARRADPSANEVPIGQVMAYSQGRLVVSLSDGFTFRVGDLVFGPSGTTAYSYRDSVIKFTETLYLNEGGDFRARIYGGPTNYGRIRAMVDTAVSDTSLGQGPLLIGCQDCVFTINLPFDRTTWKDLQTPLQTVTPVRGPVSQDATLLVNQDIWYRGVDGIRSFLNAVRNFGQEYANTPMSREVGPLLDDDDPELLGFSSAALFGNRLLMTASPCRDATMGVYHRALVILDFDLISNMRAKGLPAWEGPWTGMRILKVIGCKINGAERCFVWALNVDDSIELWELTADSRNDADGTDEYRVAWELDSKRYQFGDGFALKLLKGGQIFIDDASGKVNLAVYYRPDSYPCWLSWQTYEFCAASKTCVLDTNGCPSPPDLKPQYRTKLRLPEPPDDFDELNGARLRTGYEFQVRVEVTGSCSIKQFRLVAVPAPESWKFDRTTAQP